MLFNIYSVVIVEQHKQHDTIYSGKVFKMRYTALFHVGYIEQHYQQKQQLLCWIYWIC